MTGAVDIRAELVEQILEVLTKRGGAGQQCSTLGVIDGNAAIDALLKVVAFLIAQSPQTQTRHERRAFLDEATKYLGRQIVAAQDLKARGHFDWITTVPTAGLH